MKQVAVLVFFVCLGPSAGAVAQPRPALAQIKGGPETLRGVNAMSVVLFIDGIRDIPDSTYRSDLESRLKAAGITVLPPTESPRTYPYLSLTVDAAPLRSVDGDLQGWMNVYQLGLTQLFPRSVGGETVYYVGETYQTRGYVAGGIRIVADLRAAYIKAVDGFVADHRSVNGHAASSAARAAPERPAPPATRTGSAEKAPNAAPGPVLVNGRWDYGRVADDFMPPLPADRPEPVYIRMTKTAPGAVRDISLGSLAITDLPYPAGFTAWTEYANARPREYQLLTEDIRGVYEATIDPRWTGSPPVKGYGHVLLKCGYQSRRYQFWYKARPAAADPARLKARIPDHPLLRIGGPVESCPLTEDRARAAG